MRGLPWTFLALSKYEVERMVMRSEQRRAAVQASKLQ